jgi:rhamnulokinase
MLSPAARVRIFLQQLTMNDALYIAVDLGAGSGRVCLVGMAPGELLFEEASRFCYPASQLMGHLRWDLSQIFLEIRAGMRAAGERAREMGRAVHSIGIDSWGVDYGLITPARLGSRHRQFSRRSPTSLAAISKRSR